MKKQKNKKQTNNYAVFNIIFGCALVAMAAALIYCGVNIKTPSDKEYLDLREHLFSNLIELKYGKDNRVCEMDSYGVSKDNDVYIRFWCQDYDKITHTPIAEKKYNTLYFQHPVTGDGITSAGYAEALSE